MDKSLDEFPWGWEEQRNDSVNEYRDIYTTDIYLYEN